MTRVFVSIGSNIDREINVSSAVDALNLEFSSVRVSPIYDCAAIGFDGPRFLNLVVAFETTRALGDVIGVLRIIEGRLGRDKAMAGFASRTIDLDLLLFGDLVQHLDGVDIPRPELLSSGHMLRPVIDLEPDLIHPETGRQLTSYWPDVESKLPGPLNPIEFDLTN